MAKPRFLRRAPIVEALIDLQVSLPPDFDVTCLKTLHDQVRDRYPTIDEQYQVQASFTIQPNQPTETRTNGATIQGYLFRSADGLDVVQFRRNGLTYSRLRPYTNWETVRPELLQLWQRYRSLVDIASCTKITLRYINQIEIPIPGTDLTKYFTTAPTFPKQGPEQLNQFITRVVGHDDETGVWAALMQSSQVSAQPDTASIWLDIEVWCEEATGIPEEQINKTLETLRTWKNRIFFSSVTDRTLRRYT